MSSQGRCGSNKIDKRDEDEGGRCSRRRGLRMTLQRYYQNLLNENDNEVDADRSGRDEMRLGDSKKN